jgi:hypothetical protein
MAYTRLQAVNEIARACGEMRFSALASTGSWPTKSYDASFAGEAEAILDTVTTRVLSRGWEANTVKCKKYTIGSPGNLTFGTNVLNAVPAGPDQNERYVFRDGKAYNAGPKSDTGTFAAGDYFFDIVTDHDFSTLPTDLQVLIIQEAREEANATLKANPLVHEKVSSDKTIAEVGAQRTRNTMPALQNQQPMVMQRGNGGQG